jgi:hypothetical protein
VSNVGVAEVTMITRYYTADGDEFPGYSTNGFVVEAVQDDGGISPTYKWAGPTYIGTNLTAASTNDFRLTNVYWGVIVVGVTNTAWIESQFTAASWTEGGIGGDLFARVNVEETKEGLLTNLVLNVPEMWAFDGVMATMQRNLSRPNAIPDYAEYPAKFRPFFFREGRTNLVRIKRWFRENQDVFVDADAFTNDVLPSWDATNALDILTVTQACDNAGAPTNWAYFTPYRTAELGGWHDGVSRIHTNTYTIQGSGTNIVTNTVHTYTGLTNATIVGTNGQVVYIVETNTWIAPGFTSSDYGYKHLQAIVGEYLYTQVDSDHAYLGQYLTSIVTNFLLEISTNNYADVQTNAEAYFDDDGNWGDFSSAGYHSMRLTHAYTTNPVPTWVLRDAGNENRRARWRHLNVYTSIQHEAWIYVTFSTNLPTPDANNGYYDYLQGGYTNTGTYYLITNSTFIGTNEVAFPMPWTNPAAASVWSTAPTPVGDPFTTGKVQRVQDGVLIQKWDYTYD